MSANGELLCTSFQQSDPEVVPVRVHDEILCEVTYSFEAEEDHNVAEIFISTNAAEVAPDLFDIPETSTIVSGGHCRSSTLRSIRLYSKQGELL